MMDKSVLELARNLPRLSLEELGLNRIITTLCNNRQLLDLILKCKFDKGVYFRMGVKTEREWKAVENMAKVLLDQIDISLLLKEKILDLLWPISYRIMLWKSVYAPSIDNTFLQKFCWTERGRIDNAGTVKSIIGNRNISVRERFVLACSVCLDEEIREIWRDMPNEDREYFLAENEDKISPLLLFWAHTMEESSDNARGKYLNAACRCAMLLGLVETVKYIFAMYTKEEKSYMVIICMSNLYENLVLNQFLEEDENDIAYFLFFEMAEEHQKPAFHDFTMLVLSLLLHSSQYDLCLNLIVERLRRNSTINVAAFLNLIFYTGHFEVGNGGECRKLFIEVWRIIPAGLRSSVSETFVGGEFISVMIKNDFPILLDKGGLKKIASQALKPSTLEKESDFHRGKWEFLRFLIEEKVIKTTVFTDFKMGVLYILKITESDEAAWKRVLRFLRKIGSDISQ